ncbi:MAG: L-2-hydroxyglutarate oxidase [Candidatus Marinamargulisbacteria bacterium]|jgi:L-2-hydroxyglutarate oxidase
MKKKFKKKPMISLMETTDFAIVGGGILGLTIALEIRTKFPKSQITIFEKESDVAQHASGRNSGVLHAGFYYTSDSLKAKLTVIGNQRMKAFCKDHGLPINACQKLVVAKTSEELQTLKMLYQRGLDNGVIVHLISESEAKAIEPTIKTTKQALLSPTTATVDPLAVCQKLKSIVKDRNITLHLGEKVSTVKAGVISTSKRHLSFGHLINAAGLYADKIARQCGAGHDYVLIPFKGIYLKSTHPLNRCHIYPVPNLQHPFLGVHYTQTVTGETKIGPTAMPAFWRENYNGMANFNITEFANILLWESRLWIKNKSNFRALVASEFKKYWTPNLLREAGKLGSLGPQSFERSRPGIRAQLIHKKTYELEMDFVVERSSKATHILNAVSPGFTCAFSFASYIVDDMLKQPE